MNKIYLDNNATTPLDAQVRAVLMDAFNLYGNPSSTHIFGRESRAALAKARATIANYFRVHPQEVIFTSCGTEAMNLVLRGILHNNRHVITSNVEHSCVFSTVQALERLGNCEATYLSPGLGGAVTPRAIQESIRENTQLIAIMAANNETGVKTDITAIAEIAQQANIPLLVDGVSSLGKESISLLPGISAIGFSGHKIHAPKGIGFAIVRRSLKLVPQMTGGDQEFGRRGGTENVPGILALAKAIELLAVEMPSAIERMEKLRDKLESGIRSSIDGVTVNGSGPRIVNTTNLSFTGIEGEMLLAALDLEGIAVSHGSACSSGALEPSRVLINMGVPMELAQSAIRFSLSRFTTEEEIDFCIKTVCRIVNKLRSFRTG